MSCAGEIISSKAATLSLKGRVDFTCLNCFSQTHFASAVERALVDPDVDCVLSWRRVSCEQQLDTFQPCCHFCGIHSVPGMHLWSVF